MAHKIEWWHKIGGEDDQKIYIEGKEKEQWWGWSTKTHFRKSHWLKAPRNLALSFLKVVRRKEEDHQLLDWSHPLIKKTKKTAPPKATLLFQHTKKAALLFQHKKLLRSSGTPKLHSKLLPTSEQGWNSQQTPLCQHWLASLTQRAKKQEPTENVILCSIRGTGIWALSCIETRMPVKQLPPAKHNGLGTPVPVLVWVTSGKTFHLSGPVCLSMNNNGGEC